jgi:hypothetical protein
MGCEEKEDGKREEERRKERNRHAVWAQRRDQRTARGCVIRAPAYCSQQTNHFSSNRGFRSRTEACTLPHNRVQHEVPREPIPRQHQHLTEHVLGVENQNRCLTEATATPNPLKQSCESTSRSYHVRSWRRTDHTRRCEPTTSAEGTTLIQGRGGSMHHLVRKSTHSPASEISTVQCTVAGILGDPFLDAPAVGTGPVHVGTLTRGCLFACDQLQWIRPVNEFQSLRLNGVRCLPSTAPNSHSGACSAATTSAATADSAQTSTPASAPAPAPVPTTVCSHRHCSIPSALCCSSCAPER